MLNHPVIDFGYRIESNGKSVFFTGDHEPPYNIYEPEDDGYEEYQVFVDEKIASIHAAIQNVDVFIADSSYTDAEYPSKKGWGHGTFSSSIISASQVGAKVLFCTHHEPTRSDDALEDAFRAALLTNRSLTEGIDVRLAREGETYEF
jgi:ribonuclease BN (tRNA processing enzyme)